MTEEILIAILGSSVISALVTSLFNKIKSDKSDHLEYITKERQNWRSELREKTVELVRTPNEKIIEIKTFFEVRLNPNDKEDKKLLKLLDDLINKENRGEILGHFSEGVSFLLKHDWERVKREAKPKIKYYKVTLVILFLWINYNIGFISFNNFFNEAIISAMNKTINHTFWFTLFILSISPYLIKITSDAISQFFNDNQKKTNKKTFKEYYCELFDLDYRKSL